MSNSSDDPATLTRYSGFYKTFQCIGAALASTLNGSSPPFPLPKLVQLAINTALFAICIYPSWIVASELKDSLETEAGAGERKSSVRKASRSDGKKKLHKPLLEDYTSTHEPYNNL
jgi:hypothetical protein